MNRTTADYHVDVTWSHELQCFCGKVFGVPEISVFGDTTREVVRLAHEALERHLAEVEEDAQPPIKRKKR